MFILRGHLAKPGSQGMAIRCCHCFGLGPWACSSRRLHQTLPMLPARLAPGPAARLQGHSCQRQASQPPTRPSPSKALPPSGEVSTYPAEPKTFLFWSPGIQGIELFCQLPKPRSVLIHTTQFNLETGPRTLKTKSSLKFLLVLDHTCLFTSCQARKRPGSKTKRPGHIQVRQCVVLYDPRPLRSLLVMTFLGQP